MHTLINDTKKHQSETDHENIKLGRKDMNAHKKLKIK